MATRFGAQLMEAALENTLTRPGGVCVKGVPIDAGQITVDTYVLAASTDHISPWQNCYRTVQMVGGDVTFVLARRRTRHRDRQTARQRASQLPHG